MPLVLTELERPVDLLAGFFIVRRMSGSDQDEFELGFDPVPETASRPQPKMGLTIKGAGREALSPAQVDFNKRMVALEKGRAAYERERLRLDRALRVCVTELMPLIEKANRAEVEMIDALQQAAESVKLTARRRGLLEDLMVEKADGLLGDPVGLSEEQIGWLEGLMGELGMELVDEDNEELEREELERLRAMMEEFARQAGVNLDLNGVDFAGDPAEVARQVEERFVAAGGAFAQNPRAKAGAGSKLKRKPSKAAIERERLKQEIRRPRSGISSRYTSNWPRCFIRTWKRIR